MSRDIHRPQGNIFSRHPMMTVFVYIFICLLPSMLTRDFTPSNELRYLSISDEALADGNIFTFYNHGIPYADKPPLYFWIVMLCRLVFGQHSCLVLSLFSLIPAFGVVGIMDRWVMRGHPVMDRMAVAGMGLTCVMFLGTMIVLRMDMLMCLFIVLALWTFYRMYTGESTRKSDSVMIPVWIFLALFTKGPVGLLMPPLAIAAFLAVKRDWKGFGKYLGIRTWGIIAGLSAAWLTLAWIEGGAEYMGNLLFKQTAGRAVNAFTHAKPFWFYFVAIVWCLAPYCLLLLGSLAASLLPVRKTYGASESGASSGSPRLTASGRSDLEILFLCVIISTIAMLSSFSSKLPIYLVPVLPFLVYLFPIVLDRIGERSWMRWSVGAFSGLLAAVGVAAPLALSGSLDIPALNDVLYGYSFVKEIPVLNAAILVAVGNILGLWFVFRRKLWNIPALLLGASLFMGVFSASAVMREVNPHLGYGFICAKVPEGTDVATVFMRRPENIDVYIGRQITDYGSNCGKLIEDVTSTAEGNGSASHVRPLTIITKVSELEEHPELQSVFRQAPVIYSGPYCLTTLRQVQ